MNTEAHAENSSRVMPCRLGARARRRRITGHFSVIFGSTIAAFLLILSVATGDVSAMLGMPCLAVFLAGPFWFFGLLYLANGPKRLLLTGSQLRLVGYSRGRNVFDLRTARSEVELFGGMHGWKLAAAMKEQHVILENRAIKDTDPPANTLFKVSRALTKFERRDLVPYHPVLVLYDGWALLMPLCDLQTRQMRDPGETLLLAEIMATSDDPKIQHTAGQLRTVASWKQLPHITDADPHAIPATPIGEPAFTPIIPTPVRAGTPAPEIQITSGA